MKQKKFTTNKTVIKFYNLIKCYKLNFKFFF